MICLTNEKFYLSVIYFKTLQNNVQTCHFVADLESGPRHRSVRYEPKVQLRPVDQEPEGVPLPAVSLQVIPLLPVVHLQVVVVAVRRFLDAEIL